MPELPEVETVRRGLVDLLVGARVESVSFDWPKGFPNAPNDVNAFLLGSRITAVRRRAKVLMIDLSTEYSLVIHLKMTGQLVFVGQSTGNRFGAGHPNDSLVGELPDKSTRVVLTLDKGVLYFNDQRKFGWMKLLPTSQIQNLPFFQAVGPEPLNPVFSKNMFRSRFARKQNSQIKAALLDQKVLAGVGNIYADESLWDARIHPASRVHELTNKQLDTLFFALQDILQKAIESGGSTDRNYVDATGKKGSYLKIARVFRREGEPCFRCGSVIIKTRVAGRGTHICSACQRLSS